MTTQRPPRIYVLAGVNGAGKSSIGGAAFRQLGGEYYNPDEAARALMKADRSLSQAEANSAAWRDGVRLLERAIIERLDLRSRPRWAAIPFCDCSSTPPL